MPPDSPSEGLADILDAFDAAWVQGAEPRPVDFLPDEADRRRLVLPHLVRYDLERRFQAGLPVAAADYLADFPELQADRIVFVGLLPPNSTRAAVSAGPIRSINSWRSTRSSGPSSTNS